MNSKLGRKDSFGRSSRNRSLRGLHSFANTDDKRLIEQTHCRYSKVYNELPRRSCLPSWPHDK